MRAVGCVIAIQARAAGGVVVGSIFPRAPTIRVFTAGAQEPIVYGPGRWHHTTYGWLTREMSGLFRGRGTAFPSWLVASGRNDELTFPHSLTCRDNPCASSVSVR